MSVCAPACRPGATPCGSPTRKDRQLITAKVTCSSKTESGEGESRQALVSFMPDYASGRNKAWSLATPHLSLQMTLKGSAADLFEQGKAYTLEFVENDD